MRLVVGMTYRTRDGRTVMITERQEGGSLRCMKGTFPSGVSTDFSEDGQFWALDSEEHPCDLVALAGQETESQTKTELIPVWKKRNSDYPWGGWDNVMIGENHHG